MNTRTIQRVFRSTFAHWKLRLHQDDLASEKAGFIQEAGWLVQYCFGHDEKGGYLDYYASHRMTDDSHVRIREDGTEEDLPAMSGFYMIPAGGDEHEARRRLAEEGRKIAEMLVAKGFDKFTINMTLKAGLVDLTAGENPLGETE